MTDKRNGRGLAYVVNLSDRSRRLQGICVWASSDLGIHCRDICRGHAALCIAKAGQITMLLGQDVVDYRPFSQK